LNVYSAIQRRRSIRRFQQQEVPHSLLHTLVDAARLAPSAGNLQPLEFIGVTKPGTRQKIFSSLKWAKLVEGGDTPPEDRCPMAYVVVLINRNIAKKGGAHDAGAAVQNILLASYEEKVGSCWLRSFDPAKIKKALGVPEHCVVDSVIALGYPAESPMTDSSRKKSVEYWRDDRGVMHVPKRKLDDVLHLEKY